MGCSLVHLAMAFAIEHPAVSAAIIGPRKMEHIEDLLAGADLRLDPEVLDRIDALAPPGTSIDSKDTFVQNPAIDDTSLRRRS